MDNQGLALADVVSVEAWHDSFSQDVTAVDLFVDAVFSMGRLGAEADALVSFELCVRRAEVVVVVPPSEPLTVDPASVSRDTPKIEGKRTKATKKSQSWGLGFRALGELLISGPSGSGSLSAEAATKGSTEENTEVSETLAAMSVKNSKTEDAQHRWTLTPTLQDYLDGRPWNAKAEPRLKLVDLRKRKTGLPPAVRIEVRCRREDLIIKKIKLKDKSRRDVIQARADQRNREIAAEAYIRDQLLRRGLVVGDLRDASAQMTLAMVFAETRPVY
jgi:hypothetical protein